MLRLLRQISLRQLRTSWGRALLVIVGTSTPMARSHRTSVQSYFKGGFLACDLAVSAVSTEGGWLETPVPDEIAEEISHLDGIETVESFRILPGQMYRGARIGVVGMTDGFWQPGRFPSGWFRKGDLASAMAALRSGDGVLISVSLADRFALDVGHTIQLDAPSGVLELDVAAVVPDYVSDRSTVLLNRRYLVEHWSDHTVNRIHLFLSAGAALQKVRESVSAQFGDRYRLKILDLKESVDYLSGMIDRAYAFTFAIQLLIAVVTVAGIFDLLLAAIWERRRELAV